MDTSQQAHESKSTQLIIALVTIIVITFITFILRLYTRICLLCSTGAEDYCIGVAFVRPVILLALRLHPELTL